MDTQDQNQQYQGDEQLQETLEAQPDQQQEAQQDQQHGDQQEQHEQQQKQSGNAENIRRLRKEKEERDRELREYQQRLQELEQKMQQQSQQQDSDSEELSEHDLPEWRHVKKQYNNLKQELNQYKQQLQTQTAETKLKQQYPDFDAVVNQDTVARLREEYPYLAQSISSTQDLYTQGESAYTLIKKFGLAGNYGSEESRQRIQENTAKPQSAQTSASHQQESPVHQAEAFSRGLDESEKQRLYREMREAQKNMR